MSTDTATYTVPTDPALFLDYLRMQEDSKRDALRARLEDARADIDRALHALDQGYTVNGSGILQSNATRVDLLAAEYMQAAQTRGTFERAFKLDDQPAQAQ